MRLPRPVWAVALGCALALGGCGGGPTPPATGAARLVPSDALAYLHVSLDRTRPAVSGALSAGRRFPLYGRLLRAVDDRLGALTGTADFATAARPWIGGEAAVAVVPAGNGRAELLVVLAVRDVSAFERYAAGATPPGGVRIVRFGRFAVIGRAAGLVAAGGLARHPGASLAASRRFRAALANAPADRVIDLYATAGALRELLPGRGAAAAAALAALDAPDLAAIGASLSTGPRTGRVRIHELLTGTVTPAARFVPTLPGRIPSGAAALIDTSNLVRSAPRLLATLRAAGVLGRIGPLLSRLGAALRAEGVDLGAVESLFTGESAIAITSTAVHPSLLIVARTRRPATARLGLASIEPSIAALFPPSGAGPGQAPLFTERLIGGVTVHQLQLAPGLQLDYAVFDRLIVVATGTGAIAALAHGGGTVSASSAYTEVAGSATGSISSLVFLDLSQLIRLGEQTGLLRGTGDTLVPELARIRAIGLRSTGGKNESTAELSFTIS